jgi:methyl-coenzyme M reductase gamma subunit
MLKYPGNDKIAKRRSYMLNPDAKFKKLREIPDEDLILLLGHREPGSGYRAIHPPLDDLMVQDDPILKLVDPTPGAQHGDAIEFVQFTDSVYHSPLVPVFRSRLYSVRYKGVDHVTYSGRQLMEARARDLEKYTKELLETELFDPARSALRGITVHGSSMRLDENGLMFDARRRYLLKDGEIWYLKNQMAIPLDKPISLGPPTPENILIENSIIYKKETIRYRDAKELLDHVGKIFERSLYGGFNPEVKHE